MSDDDAVRLATYAFNAQERKIADLELGQEANRRRITELETAAAEVLALSDDTHEARPGNPYWQGQWNGALDALRSVLAAEHTQPERP